MFIIGEVRLSHSFTVATWDRYIVSMALLFLCTERSIMYSYLTVPS